MYLKQLLFKSLLVVAGLCVGTSAWADDAYLTYLTAERGWSKVDDISSIRESLGDYYFAIVSNDNTDLMVKMGAAKAGQQDTGHSMWYMNAADPLKDNTYLWMIEANNTENYVGYTFRNVDFSKRVIQTHGIWDDTDHSFFMRTNWEQAPTQWSSYAITKSGDAYTIQTLANGGSYYAGLWTYANGYVSGEELAGNKSGSEIGKFLIYKISRTDASTNAIAGAGATSTSPYELGYFLWGRANYDAYTGATNTYGPWEEDHNLRVEKYNDDALPSTGDKVTRTITTAPNGSHKITVVANAAWISGRGSVGTEVPTTNDNSTVVTINDVSQNVPVRTDGSYNPVTLTFNTTITDGNISFKITNNDAAAFWFVWEVTDLYYGVLTLNAPTITKTIKGDGTFDITITSDQSSLPVVPASTTIKYSLNGGEAQTYSSSINVAAGTLITAYTTATGYTDSPKSSASTVALPSMTQAWTQNYVGLVNSDTSMEIGDNGSGTIQNGTAIAGDPNYYYPEGTTANVGFYVNSTNRKWMLRSGTSGSNIGIGTNGSSGATTAKIYNLTKGQVIKVEGSNSIDAGGVISKLADYSNGGTNYFVATNNGTGVLNMNNGSSDVRFIYSVTVYNPDNSIIGLMDYSTGFRGDFSGFQKLDAGQSCHYTFVNHNKGTEGSNWNNWDLAIHDNAATPEYLFAVRADNWVTGTGYETNNGLTNNFNWDYFMSQMNGATVDMTVTYTNDKKLNMVATINTTGRNTWDYSYTSPAALSQDNINVTLVVDNSWIELLSAYPTIVSKTITSAGWATYCSPYALNLAEATGLTDAYIVTGGTDGVLAKTSVKGGTVPANTGLLLKGTEGSATEVTFPVVASSTTDVSANKLIGKTEEYILPANDGYVLMASPSLGFYKNNNAFTVGANTAYLPADFADAGAGARSFYLFDDELTGIKNIESAAQKAEGDFFDLQGRKVAQPTKGLYIVNGKKVIIK